MVYLSFLGSLSMVTSFITQGFNTILLLPQVLRPGACPNVPVIQDFNLDAYLGRWYEIERYANFFQSGDCVTADYKLFQNGSISVGNTDLRNERLNTLFGIATPAGSSPTEGKLLVKFPGAFTPNNDPNYNIVMTDYTTYAVVYSCSAFAGKRLEFSWILAREPSLPASKLRELKLAIGSSNIDASRYRPTRQTNCPRSQFSGKF